MNQNKIIFLNELPRSKVKNDKKGEEALRSNPLSVDKKWAPWPVAVVGGKDATEMNSQYDVFDFVFLSFRAHSAFSLRQKKFSASSSYVCMYVCMYACLPALRASLQVLQRPCRFLRDADRIGVKSARYLRMRKADVHDTGHRFHRVHPLSRRLSFSLLSFFFILFCHACFFWRGRHFRSEFATMFRVATVVTGNEAQFRHAVWKLVLLLLKSTKILHA